jgi:hypothetical protein
MKFSSNGSLALLLLAGLAGCDSATEPGEEQDPLGEHIDDAQLSPVKHGRLYFGAEFAARLSAGAREVWTFELGGQGQAHVSASTSSTAGVDTVLYLYRWDGRWTLVDKNDDTDEQTVTSSLAADLEAGLYRLVVKGHGHGTRGDYSVELGCTGDGCPAQECLWSSATYDWENPRDALLGAQWQKSLSEGAPMSSLTEQQLIAAANLVAPVDSAAYFFRTVSPTITVTRLVDRMGGREFTTYSYQTPTGLFGAAFAEDGQLVSTWHENQLSSACTVFANAQ